MTYSDEFILYSATSFGSPSSLIIQSYSNVEIYCANDREVFVSHEGIVVKGYEVKGLHVYGCLSLLYEIHSSLYVAKETYTRFSVLQYMIFSMYRVIWGYGIERLWCHSVEGSLG